ncbi:hypothetical protein OH77DRAFT_325185 [Trametes cingulata]|nr:hypothetical protein OH77DRAFT_325185 [Trametes cingulata]
MNILFPRKVLVASASVRSYSSSTLVAFTSDTGGPSPGNRRCSLLLWACLLSVLCSLINTSFTVFRALAHRQVVRSQHEPLEYASTYIGLDSAYRDPAASPLPPIHNFPVAIGVVNRSEPSAVYLDAPRYFSTFGTIYTGERRVKISPVETTIVQFWAGDYEMQRCSLEFTLPSPAGDDPLKTAEPTSVEVWHVDAPSKLDVKGLSWQSRPARVSVVARWTLYPNTTARSPEFNCRSGSFQTFELACVDDGCLGEFYQEPKHRDIGIWLMQRTSA